MDLALVTVPQNSRRIIEAAHRLSDLDVAMYDALIAGISDMGLHGGVTGGLYEQLDLSCVHLLSGIFHDRVYSRYSIADHT